MTVRHIGFLPEERDGYVLTLGRRSVADFTLRRAATVAGWKPPEVVGANSGAGQYRNEPLDLIALAT